MGLVFNPLAKKGFDLVSDSTDFDGDFVNESGDTMTGNLDVQDNVVIFKAIDNSRWSLTVDDDGALRTSPIAVGSGSPLGLLLTLTNS